MRPDFSEDIVVLHGLNLLLEGYDGIENQRELSDPEEDLQTILFELALRFSNKVYSLRPSTNVRRALEDLSESELWKRAENIVTAGVGVVDPINLLIRRDDEQRCCRSCRLGKLISLGSS